MTMPDLIEVHGQGLIEIRTVEVSFRQPSSIAPTEARGEKVISVGIAMSRSIS